MIIDRTLGPLPRACIADAGVTVGRSMKSCLIEAARAHPHCS